MRSAAIWVVIVVLVTLASCSQRSDEGGQGSSRSSATGTTLAVENGRQVITIIARGGYSPRDSIAKAGMPSVIRIVTQNTYDCSRALFLPALGVQKILPATGAAEFELPALKAGTEFYGVCAMGMYAFRITMR